MHRARAVLTSLKKNETFSPTRCVCSRGEASFSLGTQLRNGPSRCRENARPQPDLGTDGLRSETDSVPEMCLTAPMGSHGSHGGLHRPRFNTFFLRSVLFGLERWQVQ